MFNGEEPGKVKVAPVKNIASQWLVCNPVHSFGIMYLGGRNSVEDRYLRDDINLCVDSDARLCASEVSPLKHGHAEVNGLVGQTDGKAIVVREPKDLDLIDFSHSIELFSQTTMQENQLEEMLSLIKSRLSGTATLIYHNTICIYFYIHLRLDFAKSHDRIFFVSDQKSSNGRVLYQNCLEVNPNTTFITYPSELTYDLVPSHEESIGVCGATSTSREQLQEIAEIIERWMRQRYSSATAEP